MSGRRPQLIRASVYRLTPREAQVYELMSRRRTDREIAAALGITIKTVTHHARAVRGKLGVTSRQDLWIV